MNIILSRYKLSKTHTLGLLYIDGEYCCHTLEDAARDRKIKHQTCIPTGTYEIKFREADTPMTKKYRKKFSWFTNHLELQAVPNFNYVYLHIGNSVKDTSGCLLIGEYIKDRKLYNSTIAFSRTYKTITAALDCGEEVTIKVQDLQLT
jgi:hypothetical protein